MFLFLPKVYYGMLKEVSKSMRAACFSSPYNVKLLKTCKSVYPRKLDFTKIDDNITNIIASSSPSFFFMKFYFHTLIFNLIIYQEEWIRRTLILNPWWWSIFLFFVLFICFTFLLKFGLIHWISFVNIFTLCLNRMN